MKLEKARSIDLEKVITPTEADAQFQKSNIKSKFDFQCPDKNCDAQVTCANLDRPKHLRKREPYYKIIGEHSDECLIAQDIEKQPLRVQKSDIYSSEDKPIEGAFRINFQPPSTKKTESDSQGLDNKDTSSRIKADSQSNSSKQKLQASKTLSSIVDSHLNSEPIELQLPDIGKIGIKDLFIEVEGQDISSFTDKWRVYYGKAWFNKRPNSYSVKFVNKLTAGKVIAQPSFLISTESLNNSGFAKFNQQTMADIADKIPKLVFLLSKTAPYLKDSKYINIWCEAPHYMDYRL